MSEILRQRLRQRIEEKGTNPSAVALEAGLSRSAVRDILSGKAKNPGFMTLHAIARVLDCSDDYLVGRDDEMHKREASDIFIDLNARTSDISGILEAGVFRQIVEPHYGGYDDDDPFEISIGQGKRVRKPVRSKRRYIGRDLYIYQMGDDSMISRQIIKGDFIIAVDPEKKWLELVNGNIVVISAKIDAIGAEEVSARVVEHSNGAVKLVSRGGGKHYADIVIKGKADTVNTYWTASGALLTIEGSVVGLMRQLDL